MPNDARPAAAAATAAAPEPAIDTINPVTTTADRLAACPASVLHDVMKDLGVPLRVLPRTITPLAPTMRCAGPVHTLRGRPDATITKPASLDAWAGVLSQAAPGHVVICQPQDDVRALFGGLSAEAAAVKGVRGWIVDGGCRDLPAIREQGFPVFARFATPIDIVGAWRPEAFGEPIAIGGVDVRPDDHVVADADGIVLIPAEALAAVLDAAERKLATEGEMARAIRAGVDAQVAYRRFGVF
jgi:regulator of RNase E activity RraA